MKRRKVAPALISWGCLIPDTKFDKHKPINAGFKMTDRQLFLPSGRSSDLTRIYVSWFPILFGPGCRPNVTRDTFFDAKKQVMAFFRSLKGCG